MSNATITHTATSADGTAIAYQRAGAGPPLVLVDGAMCYRASGPSGPLAAQLTGDFTVYTYDRRGRGESGPGTDIAVEREIEDLEAVCKEAGGTPFVYGISSGAMLALEAANHGVGMSKLALYEAPLIVDDTRGPLAEDYLDVLNAQIDAGRNGDAVKDFMRLVEVPGFVITMMKLMPVWSKLKNVAPTLRYDVTLMESFQRGRPLPRTRWSGVTMPTVVIDGGKSPTWMRNGNKALADVLPSASYQTLPKQTHLVKPKVLAPALRSFFTS
jgi:pimeloyl-ACP methyl ester carboxylesterase